MFWPSCKITDYQKLKVRIEGNWENRNCYCSQVDYDDDNEEEEEDKEEEGGGGGGRQGTRYLKAVIQHGSDITGVQWDLT